MLLLATLLVLGAVLPLLYVVLSRKVKFCRSISIRRDDDRSITLTSLFRLVGGGEISRYTDISGLEIRCVLYLGE